MEPLLRDLGELLDAETERIIQDLLPDSRPLGAFAFEIQTLTPTSELAANSNFVLVFLVWELVAVLP